MASGILKLCLTAGLGLTVALSASAQRGGGRGAGGFAGHGIGSAPRGFSSSRGLVAPGRALFGSAPGLFRPGFIAPPPLVGTPLNPNFAPIRGVPGLGFDYQHLAAIEHPFLDRFGRGRGLFPFYPYFSPLFYDTLPLDYGDYYSYDSNLYPYQTPAPDYYSQQPQFLAPPPPQQSFPGDREPYPQAAASPPPELGQLILVRRDGQVLMAVAFTVRNGVLTYITSEGARHSFPLSELDKDATRQRNDATGTTVSLPD